MANSVMDSLETRTDDLLSKLDAMIEAAGTDWDEDLGVDGQSDDANNGSSSNDSTETLTQNVGSPSLNDTDSGLPAKETNAALGQRADGTAADARKSTDTA